MTRQAGSTATVRPQICFIIVGVLVSMLLFLAVQGQTGEVGTQVPVSGGAYTNVTAAELVRMLKAKDFFFVNVHIPYEGEIAGTDAFIPFDKVEQELNRLPARKDAKIVMYCMSDRMSTVEARALVGMGYTNIWNLQSGMVGWERQGYPLIQQPKR